MTRAFEAWNTGSETLEQVEARIHDGASGAELLPRGRGYVSVMFNRFPAIVGSLGRRPKVLEVGPGVGYLLQAFRERLPEAELHGLDVSADMIGKAKERLLRDDLVGMASFHRYDGGAMPFADGSFDFVYSCAAIQHVPKPNAYFMLMEIARITRRAVLHFLHWDHLAAQQEHRPFRDEVLMQVQGGAGHWHHFYDEIELRSIFSVALGATQLSFERDPASIWVGAEFVDPRSPSGTAAAAAVRA